MTSTTGFKAAYRAEGLYDVLLPKHFYAGVEDIDLITRLMVDHYGAPQPTMAIAEFGCGTGRVTARLAPYARRLLAMDNSSTMIDTFAQRFPDAETRVADTRQAVADLLADGHAGVFDVVGAFWSLSYPIGDCFEQLTADGIQPLPDPEAGRQRANQFVQDLVRLVAPNGHLLALFFDSDTREQRLVTRAWERIASFPEGGRRYTRQLLLDALNAAEGRGDGWLTHTRTAGVALVPSRDAAQDWFNQLHFKNLPALISDDEVQAAVAELVDECAQETGEVLLPTGVHVIDFHAVRDPRRHLPPPR